MKIDIFFIVEEKNVLWENRKMLKDKRGRKIYKRKNKFIWKKIKINFIYWKNFSLKAWKNFESFYFLNNLKQPELEKFMKNSNGP